MTAYEWLPGVVFRSRVSGLLWRVDWCGGRDHKAAMIPMGHTARPFITRKAMLTDSFLWERA